MTWRLFVRGLFRDLAIVTGVYAGLMFASVHHVPLTQPLTRVGEAELQSTVIARGKLTSAAHEQIEGSYELVSYATNGITPKPGLSLRFPEESVGPVLMRPYVGARVVIRIEVER